MPISISGEFGHWLIRECTFLPHKYVIPRDAGHPLIYRRNLKLSHVKRDNIRRFFRCQQTAMTGFEKRDLVLVHGGILGE